MGKPGRPKKNNAKLTVYINAEIKRAIQHEAVDRGMTIGEIIEEAVQSRSLMVIRESNPRQHNH